MAKIQKNKHEKKSAHSKLVCRSHSCPNMTKKTAIYPSLGHYNSANNHLNKLIILAKTEKNKLEKILLIHLSRISRYTITFSRFEILTHVGTFTKTLLNVTNIKLI